MAEPHRRRRRTPRLVLTVLGGLALVGALFAFVYPTRTYLQQRREISAAQERVAVLEEHEHELARDNARLETDAEVERRAREDYGFVRPGETSYVLVPAPAAPLP